MHKSISKVIFLIPVLKSGGAERNVVNLVKYFDKTKYQTTVAAGIIDKNFAHQLFKDIKIINFNSLYAPLLFFSVINCFKKEKPDIFVSAFPHINTLCLMAKFFSKAKTKIVLTEHTTFSHIPSTARTPFRRFVAKFVLPHFMRFFYPKADAIICVSNGVAQDLLSHIPELKKIEVIYNPIVDSSINRLGSEPLSQRWIKSKKEPIIISVGRLVKAKDYPCLLRAFKIVLQHRPCQLVILGEGKERKKLEKLSQELGISKNAAFLGYQKNPFNYMASASVFVLSSAREGFGNVVAEAMALGVPVVAAASSGPREIIENNKNGILVPIGDEESLADAILKVLHDTVFSRKLSEEGKKRAQDFTIEKSIKKYEKVFEKILI